MTNSLKLQRSFFRLKVCQQGAKCDVTFTIVCPLRSTVSKTLSRFMSKHVDIMLTSSNTSAYNGRRRLMHFNISIFWQNHCFWVLTHKGDQSISSIILLISVSFLTMLTDEAMKLYHASVKLLEVSANSSENTTNDDTQRALRMKKWP